MSSGNRHGRATTNGAYREPDVEVAVVATLGGIRGHCGASGLWRSRRGGHSAAGYRSASATGCLDADVGLFRGLRERVFLSYSVYGSI